MHFFNFFNSANLIDSPCINKKNLLMSTLCYKTIEVIWKKLNNLLKNMNMSVYFQ